MSTKILPNNRKPGFIQTGSRALQRLLDASGSFPPFGLQIRPLSQSKKPKFINRFLSYKFTQSILIPVDTFSFTFAAPDDKNPITDSFQDGDIAVLSANDIQLATGVIDSVEMDVDADSGERVSVSGRDLLAQLEDQDCVSITQDPLWINSTTIKTAAQTLLKNTRIPGVKLKDAPKGNYLFATEPGETKLSALQRFCEPLNVVYYTDEFGYLVIGRPSMNQKSKGAIFVSKTDRASNVMSIRAIHSATTIPNIILPIWSGQEGFQKNVKEQAFHNLAPGPRRLRLGGHTLQKTVVISNPQGSDPQSYALQNTLQISAGQSSTESTTQTVKNAAPTPLGSNIVQAYAKRELARANHNELIVQGVVAGHYNESAEPYRVDTVYDVYFDRAGVSERMYLFQVDYEMDESGGQRTSLYFCRLGTIVSDVRAP